MDQGNVQLTAQVRDQQFQPAPDAHVTAHIVGPDGINALVDLTPSEDTPGQYQADWTAEKPGPYLAEVTADSPNNVPLGSDVLTFQRENGIAENFHTEQIDVCWTSSPTKPAGHSELDRPEKSAARHFVL